MSEHAPISSEVVHGTAIADRDLPVNKGRRVSDWGAHMMTRLVKRSEDTLDYSIDLLRWLEPDESIVACEGTTTPADLVLSRLEFAPTGVVLWLSGGFDGIRHEVRCLVTTSRGVVKLFRFILITRGIPGTPPDGAILVLHVADAFLRDVASGPIALSVSDATVISTTPAGIVTFSVATLTFPATDIGSAATQTVTITNTGDAPLTISSLGLGGSDFAIIGLERL